MRHWWLMAIHALPYQMETINELFSLLYAGHTEKGTEQGWANLKQCRRLDACLGQTRLNSFGLMGGAQGVSRRALARGGGASGSPGVSSFILTLCIRRGSQKKSRTHGRVERKESSECSVGKQRRAAVSGVPRALPSLAGWQVRTWARPAGPSTSHSTHQRVPAVSKGSRTRGWEDRSSGRATKGTCILNREETSRSARTPEDISGWWQAAGKRCSRASSLGLGLAGSRCAQFGTRSSPRPAKCAQISARTSVPQRPSEPGLLRRGAGYARRGQARRFEG